MLHRSGAREPIFRSNPTMGCNMVVALGRATVDGHTLFGHAATLSAQHPPALCLLPARERALGEVVRTHNAEIPQIRQTHRVLLTRSAGLWGGYHGVNEHGVATGTLPLRTRLGSEQTGLVGTDLVRLILERAKSARQGVDVLT